MFSSAINSVNKNASIITTNANAVSGINKKPAKCATDPTIQGFKVCR